MGVAGQSDCRRRHDPQPASAVRAIRVRQHQERVLKMAERAAKDKERKVRSFLDALYAEKAILPPSGQPVRRPASRNVLRGCRLHTTPATTGAPAPLASRATLATPTVACVACNAHQRS